MAFFSLFTERRRFSLFAVAWVSTTFVVYRAGLWFIGWHRPCGCMGSLLKGNHAAQTRYAENVVLLL